MVDGPANGVNPLHVCTLSTVDIEHPKADTIILVCRVCGRRRIEMVAEPIELAADV